MVQYKLVYSVVRGLAEPIRLLFTYKGAEFEDVRHSFEEFQKSKLSKFHSSRVLRILGCKSLVPYDKVVQAAAPLKRLVFSSAAGLGTFFNDRDRDLDPPDSGTGTGLDQILW